MVVMGSFGFLSLDVVLFCGFVVVFVFKSWFWFDLIINGEFLRFSFIFVFYFNLSLLPILSFLFSSIFLLVKIGFINFLLKLKYFSLSFIDGLFTSGIFIFVFFSSIFSSCFFSVYFCS